MHKRNILQHNKGHNDKSTANVRLSGEKSNTFPLRPETRQECLFKIVLKVLARTIKVSTRNK